MTLKTFFVVYKRSTGQPDTGHAYRAKAPATSALLDRHRRDKAGKTPAEVAAFLKDLYDIREMRLVPVETP